jgi:hypothetical protein
MDTTLREVEDQDNNASPLFLATNGIQIKSTVDVRTDSAFIDLYDSGDTNYFQMSKENESLVILNVRQPANVDEPEFKFRAYDDANTGFEDILTLSKGGTMSQRTPKTTTAGATQSLNLGQGNIQLITLQQNTTITLTNGRPAVYQLMFTQGNLGGYTVTWGTTINWKSNTPPTITSAVGFSDIIFLLYDGSEFFGWYEQGMP